MKISFSHKDFFSKRKSDLWFTIIGVALFVALAWVFISSVRFLSTSVDSALDNQNQNTPPISFNLSALEGLGIVSSSSATTSSSTNAQ